MSTRRTVSKYFRIHPVLKETFEKFCGALRLNQSDVLEKLISDWCDLQKDQVRLDVYVPSSGNIIIKQPRSVNIAVKAELTYYKMELSRLLGVLETAPKTNQPEFLKQLIKLVLKASKIQMTTQDEELGDLLAKAEIYLG